MSETFSLDEERDLLAAEYALGLLDGGALIDARGRLAREPEFAAAVDQWESRLALMMDGFAEVTPPPEVWARIEQALDSRAVGKSSVARLPRRERLWRGWAAGMTALAAGLALALTLDIARQRMPPPPAPVAQRGAVLVASLTSEDTAAAFAVAFELERGTMVVTPSRLGSTREKAHELWLIAREGAAPVSLGVVRLAVPHRMPIPFRLRNAVTTNATIAVSIEPSGGAPAGSPTGPILASDKIRHI